MKKRLTSVVVTGAIVLGGLGAGLVAVPVIASAATAQTTGQGSVTQAVGDRLEELRGALDGLVSDGTIDDAQADQVAETLDEALPQRGHGGHGGGRGGLALDEAATVLGLTEDQLLAELEAGQSLATVAETQGVALDTLVDGLVTAAQEHVAEHLAAGDITQAEADERLAGIQDRVSTLVLDEDLAVGHGHEGRGDDAGTTDDSTTETPAPTGEATVQSSGLTA